MSRLYYSEVFSADRLYYGLCGSASEYFIFRDNSGYSEFGITRAFRLLESGEALKIPEERFSLRSQGLPPLKNLSICFLKMFPDCLTMTAAGHLRPSSVRWMTWGTMSHGRCLTAQILASPKPEKECSLSDFLEKNAPEEYYLSRKQIQKLLSNAYLGARVSESTIPKDSV